MAITNEKKNSEHSASEKQITEASGIASNSENQRLEHTEGGATTRDDVLDLGVPMLPGSPDERQGPEDALGPGPKRGDYTNRIGDSNYQPHESVAVNSRTRKAGESAVRLEAQRPRAEDIGDAPNLKGGVDTGHVK